MAIVKSRKSQEQISLNSKNRLLTVRVKDIILDINHPQAEKYGGNDAIGTIFYSDLTYTNGNPKHELTATPLFSHVKYYPLINEIVLILSTNDKDIYGIKKSSTYYLPQINMWGHPHHNALPTAKDLESNLTIKDYQETGAGLVRKVEDGGTDITLGKYFKEQINIKPLLPYEGDMILEGRFGNSIRFGSTNISDEISNPNGWSDLGNTGDPITIIRNGQSSNLDEKGWLPTIENINEDASSIYLTSNQRVQNFKQASPYKDSWDAEYIKPRTLEQTLLNPTVTLINTNSNKLDNPLPSTNEDLEINENLNNKLSTPIPETSDLDILENNPEAENEVEIETENQGIKYDDEIELPSSYEDPGSGENEGGGISIYNDTTK
tara:strand:+ start:740 stop:1876 length:1137 start_codon:yes stop_codon:yes gene_type:complete